MSSRWWEQKRLAAVRAVCTAPEFRATMTKVARRRAKSPSFRRAMSAARQKLVADPTHIALVSRVHKKRWQENRPRLLLAFKKKLWNNPVRNRRIRVGVQKVWAAYSRTEKDSRIRTALRASGVRPNKSEKKLFSLLEEHFPSVFVLNVVKASAIGGKIPDIISKDGRFVVELFGEYWHVDGEVPRRKRHFRRLGITAIIVWGKELHEPARLVARVRRVLKPHYGPRGGKKKE
jgi:very-short-patch-repair endonuclease